MYSPPVLMNLFLTVSDRHRHTHTHTHTHTLSLSLSVTFEPTHSFCLSGPHTH